MFDLSHEKYIIIFVQISRTMEKKKDVQLGQKVTLLADRDQLCAGESAYIVKILANGRVDLSNKPLDYCPQDDCVPDRMAHNVSTHLLKQ